MITRQFLFVFPIYALGHTLKKTFGKYRMKLEWFLNTLITMIAEACDFSRSTELAWQTWVGPTLCPTLTG